VIIVIDSSDRGNKNAPVKRQGLLYDGEPGGRITWLANVYPDLHHSQVNENMVRSGVVHLAIMQEFPSNVGFSGIESRPMNTIPL
jgi:hypothetical protein